MVSKEELRKRFSREHGKYYDCELFEREGFQRFECRECGKAYWAARERANCGDSSHEPYSFFKQTPSDVKYVDFLLELNDFWAKHDHEVLQRYPILSRWREDLFFVIADVVDFQRIENGKTVFEYPANPCVVPQPCLRFVDIANVGVTGRHLTGFVMYGQKAFDYPKEGYWRDETIAYNYELLTKMLRLKKTDVTYAEDVWSMPDYSAFGPCIESFSKGSELVNNVFMQYYLDGDRMLELPLKVVDVGWGFERLLWYARGDATIYEASFPDEVNFLKQETGLRVEKKVFDDYIRLSSSLDVENVRSFNEEKKKIAKALGLSIQQLNKTIAPMQAVYAIADHSRSLLFALTDGALPSNTGGGYNLRVLARRIFSFVDEFELSIDLLKLFEMHARDFKKIWPEYSENLNEIHEIIDVEEKKYFTSLENARRKASEVLAKGVLSDEAMALLYESHGVTPELVEKVAGEQGRTVEIPTNFYHKLTEKHLMEAPPAVKTPIVSGLTETKKTYYEKPDLFELKARVIAVMEKTVVTDETIFYPEGGGQCADHGFLEGERVYDVQENAGVIHHFVENAKKFKPGQTVLLKVDKNRRDAITRHHSSTHLLIAALRAILGKHVWQCGSKKDEDEAHLDVTHYARLTREQLTQTEALANETIWRSLPITVKEMPRGEAERKYSFRLYQGGGAIGPTLRVVEIKDFDVEACGGLHRKNTSEIGFIKITRQELVQDGVLRVYYKAGPQALKHVQEDETLLQEAALALNTTKKDLPKSLTRIFEEWKQRGKEVEHLQEQLSNAIADKFVEEARAQKTNLIKIFLPAPPRVLEKIVLRIASEKNLAAIAENPDGTIVAAAHPESSEDAAKLVREAGAKGGGKKDFARGKKV